MKAQRITDKTLDITVHVLVFTGLSSDAVKTHAQYTGVTTGKDGVGMLTIYFRRDAVAPGLYRRSRPLLPKP